MQNTSNKLIDIASRTLKEGFGILAADEGKSTIENRFNSIGVENIEENRRSYREMLFSAKDAFAAGLSGVITFEETLFHKSADGTPFAQLIKEAGAVVGIKADIGTVNMPGCGDEKITKGFDDLPERLKKYSAAGAEFTKWRAVLSMNSADGPSRTALAANTNALAMYAAFAQASGMVPIIEPELLTDGAHSIEDCANATENILRAQFAALVEYGVQLEGIILKPNMVTQGKESHQKPSVEQVAELTLTALKRTVPSAVPGIAFLSGGQNELESTAHLNAMTTAPLPWILSFSYGRALQAKVLKTWAGKSENNVAAQQALKHRVRMNSLASLGKWSSDLEN